MRDLEPGYPLLDGNLFGIVSDGPRARVSYDFIKLQWDLLRMLVLCGAAEAVDDPDWNPGEDMREVEAGGDG